MLTIGEDDQTVASNAEHEPTVSNTKPCCPPPRQPHHIYDKKGPQQTELRAWKHDGQGMNKLVPPEISTLTVVSLVKHPRFE